MRPPSFPRFTTYQAIVTNYQSEEEQKDESRMERFRDQHLSLAEAISRACESKILADDGSRLVRHPHQCRIPSAALADAAARLLRVAGEINRCSDFASLHAMIEETIKPVSGIGELAIYDIAHRIGAYLCYYPKEVYLHRGTRKGARQLMLDAGRKTIPMGEFPKELRGLKPHQLEDVLCIYCEDLGKIARRLKKRT